MKQHRAEGLSQAWPSHNILIRAIPQIASVGAREDRLDNKRLMVCKVKVFFMALNAGNQFAVCLADGDGTMMICKMNAKKGLQIW